MKLFPDFKRIVGLVVPVHDRYEYLTQFHNSLSRSDLSGLDHLSIVDDFSSDQRVINFLHRFEELRTDKLTVSVSRNPANLKIYGTLKRAMDRLLEAGCTLLGVIDPDAIMNRDWLNALLSLSDRFPGNICSAFNTTTGGRHQILKTGVDYCLKQSIGGINMLFSHATYVEVIRPSLSHGLQWDVQACVITKQYGKQIFVTKPSRVQHIGHNSTLDHHDPDVALDFKEDKTEEAKSTSSLTSLRVLATSCSPSP